MERKLKERITGAVILVTLGIVIIPSILDGDVRERERQTGLDIPPPGQPSATFRTVTIPTDESARVPVTAETVMRPSPAPQPSPRSEDAPSPVPSNDDSATVADATSAAQSMREAARQATPLSEPESSAPPPSREPAPVARVAPPPAQPAVSVPRAEERPVATLPPPSRVMAPDPAAGWAVQVGSFANQGNAERLASTLTELDYKAFVSRKRLDGRVLFRVRVGPKATRDEALELASRLKKDRQAVSVVPHPG